MWYVIDNKGNYVRHTVRCGPFYGRVPKHLVDSKEDARRFTREADAKKFAQLLSYLANTYEFDSWMKNLMPFTAINETTLGT